MTRQLVSRVGNWVAGDDFFGRELEVSNLVRRLEEGAHVSLAAQRRIGKTSLLHQVARLLEGRFVCLYVDLEDCRDAADAVVAITLAAKKHTLLWTKIRSAFDNVLGGIESIGADQFAIKLRDGVAGDWRAKGDRILGDLATSALPVVLMLDEVPVLLTRMLRDEGRPRPGGVREADGFLSWLRKGCIAHAGSLRIVVTGSIGLEPVARQVGLSGTLNVYTPFELGPWQPEVAIACLAALARNYSIELDADAAEEMVELIGCCIPYHVQLFFQLLEEDSRRRPRAAVSRADVQRVYATRMLSSRGHAELAHLEERLRLVIPSEQLPFVLDLLTEAAVVGVLTATAALRLAADGLPPTLDHREALRSTLGILEHDGYLRGDPDGHRFESKLLRDWWNARFGAFYQRTSQRSP